MTVTIYNTLTNHKEELKPLEPGKISMYVCGVTVYDMSHIGHARAYVTADVIYRFLEASGFEVTYVRNFTDVDDKIIKRANELGITTNDLTEQNIKEFHKDMDALGVKRPDIEPRVTDHIPEIIATVEALVDRGHAYVVEGDVYFDVPSWAEYGKLSKRNLDDLKAGARVQVDERKRTPMDFALWKASKPGEPMWNSPWGKGRPGWHIECTAMSTKYLGQTFDIHGGGKDLVFPHHENEIAQAEAAYGVPFVNYFFHNGFVNIDKEKMSKSLNNFFTIREICERYDPEALRYFLLTTHYRSPINFEVEFICPHCKAAIDRAAVEDRKCPDCESDMNDEQAGQAIRFPSLEDGQKRLNYLYTTRKRLDEFLGNAATGVGVIVRSDEVEALRPRFDEAMNDDFNAAAAVGVLADAMRLSNEVLDNKEGKPEAMITSTVQVLENLLDYMSSVVGILERDASLALQSLQSRAVQSASVDAAQIDGLVVERNQARAAKDFARADQIRDQLIELGVELMDGPQGTTWKIGG
ncbi:MAG: cysteine--tRNA ligase [Deltaproteobacteria bacterium]|nr:cysteine--tRNA ligase [Deltaproteobacteria bacterium]